jgi:hypothetical protein
MKKPRSEKQLANDRRLAEAAKARRTAPPVTEPVKVPAEESPEPATDVQDVVEKSTMQKQIDELMETQALLKAALLKGNAPANASDSVGVGQGNKLVGEVDKYLVDERNYPDPTPRLAAEPRLQTIAFNHNYELEYEFKIRSYETKTGLNMREPEFIIELHKIVLDDQGNRVMVLNPKNGQMEEKRYKAKRLMFHEDPQAALVIARENNLDVDKSDEKTFLDEMRYYRVRDWLFGVFWPQPVTSGPEVREEAIGGTLVQVFTKSSVEPSAVDFDQLKNKVQA